MKKSKGQTIDSFYINKKETKNKKKKNVGTNGSRFQKRGTNSSKKKKTNKSLH